MAKETSKIKNIEQLRENLLENYERLCNGELDLDTSKEITNMAGKVINSAKVQMQYHELRKIDKPISFLETK